MVRVARKKSRTGIYHIMLRGVNKKQIFHDDEDHMRFLEVVGDTKEKSSFQVYGWCLMGNHVHLLLCEGNEDISISMKRIGVSYAWYYHTKYKTVGHLFQDRFRSEPVDQERYLLTVIRYIHQNPAKAGIVRKPDQWRWSSCCGYYGKPGMLQKILDRDFILGLFSQHAPEAIAHFRQFNEIENNDQCLDDTVEESHRLSDREAREAILKCMGGLEISHINTFDPLKRNEILRKVKKIQGISQRQAAKILGISKNIIYRA